eukprot:1530307-Amphidinium_carterae.1
MLCSKRSRGAAERADCCCTRGLRRQDDVRCCAFDWDVVGIVISVCTLDCEAPQKHPEYVLVHSKTDICSKQFHRFRFRGANPVVKGNLQAGTCPW